MTKVAVITGGTKGIGKALVRKFASQGFDIFSCAKSKEDLDKLSADLKSEFPLNNFKLYQSDLSVKENVLRFAENVLSESKNIDVLINNTGIYVPGQIHNEEEGVMEKLMETNLYSAYYLTRALINKMIKSGCGHVFNICSTASITPYVNGGSYCMSKYAMYGMTKVLREEMKPMNIKVTAILPGATFTASWEGADIPESRFMKPEDVAQTIYSAYDLPDNAVIEEILLRPQLGDLG